MEIVRLVGTVAGRRRILTLHRDQSVIGSAPGADFVIDDPAISPRHARIIQAGADYQLSDLLSASGTYRNGLRVNDPVLLRKGDEIRFGRSTFRVERADTPAAPGSIVSAPPVATTEQIREATTGAVAFTPAKSKRGATNDPHAPRNTVKRKRIGPAAAALTTVLLVILGFGAAIYFVTWDRIEDLAENASAPNKPAAITSVRSSRVRSEPSPITTPPPRRRGWRRSITIARSRASIPSRPTPH